MQQQLQDARAAGTLASTLCSLGQPVMLARPHGIFLHVAATGAPAESTVAVVHQRGAALYCPVYTPPDCNTSDCAKDISRLRHTPAYGGGVPGAAYLQHPDAARALGAWVKRQLITASTEVLTFALPPGGPSGTPGLLCVQLAVNGQALPEALPAVLVDDLHVYLEVSTWVQEQRESSRCVADDPTSQALIMDLGLWLNFQCHFKQTQLQAAHTHWQALEPQRPRPLSSSDAGSRSASSSPEPSSSLPSEGMPSSGRRPTPHRPLPLQLAQAAAATAHAQDAPAGGVAANLPAAAIAGAAASGIAGGGAKMHADMLCLGAHLLSFACSKGWPATAACIIRGLLLLDAQPADLNKASLEAFGLPLAHVAVASGSPALVLALSQANVAAPAATSGSALAPPLGLGPEAPAPMQQQQHEQRQLPEPASATASGSSGSALSSGWCVLNPQALVQPGPAGLTPLHMAAVLPGGAQAAVHLISCCPGAARAWFAVVADDGLTPAAYAQQAHNGHINDHAVAVLAMEAFATELPTPGEALLPASANDGHGASGRPREPAVARSSSFRQEWPPATEGRCNGPYCAAAAAAGSAPGLTLRPRRSGARWAASGPGGAGVLAAACRHAGRTRPSCALWGLGASRLQLGIGALLLLMMLAVALAVLATEVFVGAADATADAAAGPYGVRAV